MVRDRRKILVVENKGIVSLDIKNILINEGYDAICVNVNYEKMLSSVIDFNPDLVLIDIGVMSKDIGYEFGELITKSFGISVIYLSGYTVAELKFLKNSLKDVPIVYKPFDKDSLLKAVSETLIKRMVNKEKVKLQELKSDINIYLERNPVINISKNFGVPGS
jgi:chemotaxis response regulator CheB